MVAEGSDGGDIIAEDGWLDEDPFVRMPAVVALNTELSAGARLLFMALIWYRWQKLPYPGHAETANEWGMGKRSVVRYFRELQDAGLVECRRRGLGQANTYIIKSLMRQIGTSRTPTWRDKDARLALPSIDSDSDVDSTIGDGADSELEHTVQDITAAIGQPKQASQLLKTARKQGYPAAILRAACETTLQQMNDPEAPNIENPVKYLQAIAKQRHEFEQQAAEAQELSLAKRKAAARGQAQHHLSDVIPWTLAQMAQMVAENYGKQIAGEVMAELQAESGGEVAGEDI